MYKRLRREQESEGGVWFNTKRDREHKETFRFVKHVYERFLLRLTIPRRSSDVGLHKAERNEFVALDVRRDSLERTMKLKRVCKIGKIEDIGSHFAYLRRYICKELMVLSLARTGEKILCKDLCRPIVKAVFSPLLLQKALGCLNSGANSVRNRKRGTLKLENLTEALDANANADTPQKKWSAGQPQWNEYIPKSKSSVAIDDNRDKEVRHRDGNDKRDNFWEAIRKHGVHFVQKRGPQTGPKVYVGRVPAPDAGRKWRQT